MSNYFVTRRVTYGYGQAVFRDRVTYPSDLSFRRNICFRNLNSPMCGKRRRQANGTATELPFLEQGKRVHGKSIKQWLDNGPIVIASVSSDSNIKVQQ
jgi:hypothetical protein